MWKRNLYHYLTVRWKFLKTFPITDWYWRSVGGKRVYSTAVKSETLKYPLSSTVALLPTLRQYFVINSFKMKMTKKDIKYIIKLFIAYPTSLLFGIIGYRKGFDKMIMWLNKDE